jgi:hypothetical protein
MISLAGVCYGDSQVTKHFLFLHLVFQPIWGWGNPDFKGSCSLASHCNLSDRSEQNSSKLQHTVCNVFISCSAIERAHSAMSLEVVWQQRVNDDGGLMLLMFVPQSYWVVWSYIHIQGAWKEALKLMFILCTCCHL